MNYPLHLAILVLLWGYIYTSWSLMGRLGLVSFGHAAFYGIGAFSVALLVDRAGLPPLAALALAPLVASVLVGVVESLGILWVPEASLAIVFAVLVVVLAIRPQGLRGATA